MHQMPLRGAGEEELPPPPPGLNGHIILCGLSDHPDALLDFLAPLRSKVRFTRERAPSVLLLLPYRPRAVVWGRARDLCEVYYLRGSFAEREDLRAAGALNARCIALAAGAVTDGSSYDDASCVLAYSQLASWKSLLTPIVAQLWHSSTLELLVSNDELLRKINLPIDSCASSHQVQPETNPTLSAHIVSGRVVPPWLANHALCRMLELTRLLELLKLLLHGVEGWCLTLTSIPAAYEGKSYGELVEFFMVGHSILPLGMLRSRAFHFEGPPEVVLPNPPSSTVVSREDRLFVLEMVSHES
ncbi:MAG: hypothetical protein SGPRY_014712 [Prymnesium sp.]